MSKNEKIVIAASAAVAATLPTIAFIKAIRTGKRLEALEEKVEAIRVTCTVGDPIN